jgi:hypothetical protein
MYEKSAPGHPDPHLHDFLFSSSLDSLVSTRWPPLLSYTYHFYQHCPM